MSQEKPNEWNSFSQDDYSNAISNMVHQSYKQVNTNADAGGVRIGSDRAMKSPYICVRSLMARGVDVPLERITGAATNKIYSNIRDIEAGVAEQASGKEKRHVLKELKAIRKTDMTIGERICPRLRQILLPTESGYLAVTPMSSVGLCVEIDKARRVHHERIRSEELPRSEYFYISTAKMAVGGANPVNIGTYAGQIQQIIMGRFPVSNSSLRRAVAIHHNGIRIRFSKALVNNFLAWRASGKWVFDNRMKDRKSLKALMENFASEMRYAGNSAYDTLACHKSKLPVDEAGVVQMLSEKVNNIMRGFILVKEQSPSWRSAAACVIADTLKIKVESNETQTLISQDEYNAMVKSLEKAL